MQNIENYEEYKLAERILTPLQARRAGVSYFTHVKQGLAIMDAYVQHEDYPAIAYDPIIEKLAFCLHPLIQKVEDFKDNYYELKVCNPLCVALAVEYRWTANLGLRPILEANGSSISLSEFNAVNLMLIADKVQNYYEFLKYARPQLIKEDKRIDLYFRHWLSRLDIDDKKYEYLTKGLDGEPSIYAP